MNASKKHVCAINVVGTLFLFPLTQNTFLPTVYLNFARIFTSHEYAVDNNLVWSQFGYKNSE